MIHKNLATRVWKYKQQYELGDFLLSYPAMHPLVKQAIFQRGFRDMRQVDPFLDFWLYSPLSPYELPGMQKGIERTIKAIRNHERIGIWGDFDVDGQTSTAVLVSTLRELGAEVYYHVPIRSSESHGIQLEALKNFTKNGLGLLITCDTGITAYDSIVYAQNHGLDVVVTDHHTLPTSLPPAFSIINPQMLDKTHALHPLPGVGTAFKFCEALLDEFHQSQYSTTLHDLAALGIIADVASLTGENRYLVQSGMNLIRQSCRPSIQTILDTANIDTSHFCEEQIAFAIAPRLNAVGRLSDANPVVEFLLSKDPTILSVMVNQLEGLNARRQLLCDQVFQGTLAQIEKDPTVLDHPVLILSHAEWPAGVIGISASRLVEILHRPVILLTGTDSGILKGSARSVEGVNIIRAISEQENLLLSFGGHPMAAGLSLNAEDFRLFQRGLDESIAKMLLEHPTISELEIDAQISPFAIDLDLINSIEQLAPFGAGNPPLVFESKTMKLVESLPVGKTKDHLQMTVEDQKGNLSKLIWWQGAGFPQPEGLFNLAFTARSSNYQGKNQVQLEWIDYQIEDTTPLNFSSKESSKIHHIDYRNAENPEQILNTIAENEDLIIWKEGTDDSIFAKHSRNEIYPIENLIVWTIPPSNQILEKVVDRVKPKKIYWFANTPKENDLSFLLRTVSKYIKEHLENLQTTIDIDELAAQNSVTSELIQQVLYWLSAKGDISIKKIQDDHIELSLQGICLESEIEKQQKIIKRLIQEIQSYRVFYQSTDLQNLLHS